MSGYLGYFGLWGWYRSQPKEIQDFLYRSCGLGINTDSDNLFNGDFNFIGSGEESWTPTRFLGIHAMNAFHLRLPEPFYVLLQEAEKRAGSAADREYLEAVRQRTAMGVTPRPSEEEIQAVKSAILDLIGREPGILQKDIKKRIPGDLEAIGIALSAINHEELVRREKKGNTFKMYLAGAAPQNSPSS